MITEKKLALRPILESSEGVHLTVYLVNRGNLLDLKSQLREVIAEASEWLQPVQNAEVRKKFLEPLDSLLKDPRILMDMKGNIGIFRNKDSFRVLNIPIEVEQSCQVATSFHVKPLLRWLQSDEEFLLLGLEKETAHIYLGSQHSFKLIDLILFPEFLKKKDAHRDSEGLKSSRQNNEKEAEMFSWLSDQVTELTKRSKIKLFLAGEPKHIRSLQQNLKYKNLVKTAISPSFSKTRANDLCQSIRKILKEESRKNLEKALMEFRFAEEDNRARKNIFQISKAVVQGKVRKLIVTDELSIFGKIDQTSGGLAIHPMDLDHEDDCILDDLAQMVLNQGGEVVIAKRDEIPKGRPILAILDDEGESLMKTEGPPQYEVLQGSMI